MPKAGFQTDPLPLISRAQSGFLPAPMEPLDSFPMAARRRIRGVLADIDDTITTDGKLTAAAYGALERLQAAGFRVVPITGRPAGWCDHIARMWPVDAVVGENRAFYFPSHAPAPQPLN